MSVSERFNQFIGKLKLTDAQYTDGTTKHQGVRECLNSYYYNSSSKTANSMLVGSWGKDTDIRPPRDIDVLFVLPYSVYQKYELRTGNRQSQLLQEIKEVLIKTYTSTKMRGDGQVVIVPFASYPVEVLPAFKLNNGRYYICDTKNGGRYKTIDAEAEIQKVSDSNKDTSGNTRALIRMLKRWQEYCSVPLKSFVLELLAIEFLENWEHKGKSSVYYDWMVRDFFKFLIGKENGYVFIPGTWEIVYIGNDWKSKTESAYTRAKKACDYESAKNESSSNDEWGKIFGIDIRV